MQQTVTIVNQNSCDRNFPFRKQAMPFTQHLNSLTLNKFFSTKLKKKEI